MGEWIWKEEWGKTASCTPPPLLQSPPPKRGDCHLDKKAQEILGAEDKISLGYIGTAAILVLPSCGVQSSPPPSGGPA